MNRSYHFILKARASLIHHKYQCHIYCFLAAEPSSSYTLQNKLTILLTHVLYKEYIPKHVVSLDISGKCSLITGKLMLISGSACKDEVNYNKWNRETHCEQSRVVIVTGPISHPTSIRQHTHHVREQPRKSPKWLRSRTKGNHSCSPSSERTKGPGLSWSRAARERVWVGSQVGMVRAIKAC